MTPPRSSVPAPPSPVLTASQLARIAELGQERTAAVGEVLYRVGDRRYPFMVILEGLVLFKHDAAYEILRHSEGGFLGELSLLSGQTVLVTAVVTRPLRYIAVERETFRALLFDDEPLSDLVLSTFIARREALQQIHGIGIEIVGPRSSSGTLQILEFARANRVPFTWRDPDRGDDPE